MDTSPSRLLGRLTNGYPSRHPYTLFELVLGGAKTTRGSTADLDDGSIRRWPVLPQICPIKWFRCCRPHLSCQRVVKAFKLMFANDTLSFSGWRQSDSAGSRSGVVGHPGPNQVQQWSVRWIRCCIPSSPSSLQDNVSRLTLGVSALSYLLTVAKYTTDSC
jgi:hypothetical protein